MRKSFAAWALARSALAYVRVTRVDPPTNMRFQPTPRRTKASQKCQTPTPARATARLAPFSAMPSRIVARSPIRWISVPVKNPGRNIPTMCHWITNTASPSACPWCAVIASGVPVMSRFIAPYPAIWLTTATRKVGCRTIARRGRVGPAAWSETAAGSRSPSRRRMVTRASAGTARKDATNVVAMRSAVRRASCGPTKLATRPPASTMEMARLRSDEGTASAAAKRYSCPNADDVPTRALPRARSQKLAIPIAAAARRPPAMANPVPAMNPSRRPARRMRSEAGIVPRAVPTTTAVAGSVASALSLASACPARLPRSPPATPSS